MIAARRLQRHFADGFVAEGVEVGRVALELELPGTNELIWAAAEPRFDAVGRDVVAPAPAMGLEADRSVLGDLDPFDRQAGRIVRLPGGPGCAETWSVGSRETHRIRTSNRTIRIPARARSLRSIGKRNPQARLRETRN